MRDILWRKLEVGDLVCMKQTSRSWTLKLGVLLNNEWKCYYDWVITSYDSYFLIENPSAFELEEKLRIEKSYEVMIRKKEEKKKIKGNS